MGGPGRLRYGPRRALMPQDPGFRAHAGRWPSAAWRNLTADGLAAGPCAPTLAAPGQS